MEELTTPAITDRMALFTHVLNKEGERCCWTCQNNALNSGYVFNNDVCLTTGFYAACGMSPLSLTIFLLLACKYRLQVVHPSFRAGLRSSYFVFASDWLQWCDSVSCCFGCDGHNLSAFEV